MYAHDLIIMANDHSSLQKSICKIAEWYTSNKMEINTNKTKILKFRKGGRLKRSDINLYNNTPFEFVNNYTYLGITLSTKLSFFQHIKNIKSKAICSLYSIKNLNLLNIETTRKVYNMKTVPIFIYAMASFSNLLTFRDLTELDKIKASFIKRLLGYTLTCPPPSVIFLSILLPCFRWSLSNTRLTKQHGLNTLNF